MNPEIIVLLFEEWAMNHPRVVVTKEFPAATPQQMDKDQQDFSRRRKPKYSPCGDGTFVMFLLLGDRIRDWLYFSPRDPTQKDRNMVFPIFLDKKLPVIIRILRSRSRRHGDLLPLVALVSSPQHWWWAAQQWHHFAAGRPEAGPGGFGEGGSRRFNRQSFLQLGHTKKTEGRSYLEVLNGSSVIGRVLRAVSATKEEPLAAMSEWMEKTADPQVVSCEAVVLVLVGLPARGKSFICGAVVRHLKLLGVRVRSFNAGELRRESGKAGIEADFFSSSNVEAKKVALIQMPQDLRGSHTVLLRSDGTVVARGLNENGQCDIPPLDKGISYTQVSAGLHHTVLLRSDGSVVACGLNNNRQCDIPPGTYTQVSAGGFHTVLLRKDGRAVARGRNYCGQCNVPPLDRGGTYTQVSASSGHTVLLRSDGQVLACGNNQFGQCSIPPLEEGITYTQVSAGEEQTMLLRSDGHVVACGYLRCDLPPLEDGLPYVQVSAGWDQRPVLLRCDGKVVMCASDETGEDGVTYVQVSAGRDHAVFLRTDGSAFACGLNQHGQCSIPPPEPGTFYVEDRTFHWRDRVLQLDFVSDENGFVILTCLDLAGQEVLRLKAQGSDLALDAKKRIADKLHISLQSLQVVLPDGDLLATICKATPLVTVADLRKSRGDE
eukprot:s3198_g8.t1